MNLLELFCHVDDFLTIRRTSRAWSLDANLQTPNTRKSLTKQQKDSRTPLSMTVSEIMTILIHFLVLQQHLS
jgi:hypothetical protein